MDVKDIRPNPEQVEWANCEIGVLIHYDLPVFQAPYDCRQHFGDPIPASVFDPKRLDTDQWLAAAKSLGARYAILVAKHGTGFSLWPTQAHGYSVKNTPYKDGQGDIVGEFIDSCKKYGLRPGLYCSASFNQYFSVENPGLVLDGDPVKQKAYNDMVEQQLTELWTNYGDLFEIWFDGGVIPVSEGGPDVAGLLHRLQPNAVVFQGPVGTRSLLRWVGNERGVAPEDCSALYDTRVQADTGDVEREDGCAAPLIWCPAESDFPNRYAHRSYQGGWFWREGEEDTVLPADELFGCYLTSVGRNTNMLVGMVIDTEGRFPDTDAAVFAETGERIRRVFGAPIAVGKAGETELILPEDPAAPPAYAVLREDITMGERVTGYTLRAYDREGNEIFSHNGKVISHKRILKIPAATARVKLDVTDGRDDPVLLPLEICSEG